MDADRDDAPFAHDAPRSREWDEIRHPRKRAMLAALARTGNVSAASRAAGIPRRTHYEWTASDPAYAAAVREAFEEAVEVLEAVARSRAIHGSDTMLIFLLKSLRPERYRERYEVRHDGQIALAERIRADVTKVLADPELTRRIEDRFLGTPGIPRIQSPTPEES